VRRLRATGAAVSFLGRTKPLSEEMKSDTA
jgi:hypothetical protein